MSIWCTMSKNSGTCIVRLKIPRGSTLSSLPLGGCSFQCFFHHTKYRRMSLSNDALLLQNTVLCTVMGWTASTLREDGRVLRNCDNKDDITDLCFAYCNLQSVFIASLPPVHSLNFRYSLLTKQDLQRLIPLCTPTLEVLILGNNNLSHCNALLSTIKQFAPNLKRLDLEKTQLSNVEQLHFPTNLNVLILSDNVMTTMASFQIPPRLTELYLQRVFMKTAPRFSLSESTFPSHLPDTLKILDISYNSITSLKFMRLPSSLTSLSLSAQEPLGRRTCRILSELRFPANLQEVKCSRLYSMASTSIDISETIHAIKRECRTSRMCKEYIEDSIRTYHHLRGKVASAVARFIMHIHSAFPHLFRKVLRFAYHH